ncbi:MAG TPA: thiol-activated cytolysin family protein [Longimicrobiales bacterium]|nr:thiol-activated cytolysin family protein [Longimicrobiales bacterium]
MLARGRVSVGILCAALLVASCEDEGTGPLGEGDLQVGLAMTGEVVDGDGAAIRVDGEDPRPVFAGSGIDYEGLLAGSHVVELVELAEHCTVVGQNPRAVTIIADHRVSTTFDVSCGTPSVLTLADLIAGAGVYAEEQPRDEVIGSEEFTEFSDDGTEWQCTKERHSVVEAPMDYATFDPNAEVIYPANMLQGATLEDATPEPVVVKRAGATVTINLLNGSSGVSQHVDEVKQSTIVQAVNDIIAQQTGVVPARFTYRSSSVQSQEQLALALGVNVKTLGTKVKAQLAFSTDRDYNRMMVEFVQSYYTVSMDLPRSLSELFHPSVTAGDLAPYVGPGNPPTYISSVTYGRRFVILIESTSSRMEIESKVKASYNAAVANVKLSSEADYVSNLKEVNIKVFALGGDQSLATAMFNGDSEDLRSFLTQGGGIDTGVPLSYVVRNVRDNSVVNVKVASDYDVTTCRIVEKERFYSGFAEGTDGWTSYDNGTGTAGQVAWKGQDQCPGSSWGGCLYIHDATSDYMRFSAPALWRDRVSWSAFMDGTIHYMGRIGHSGGSWTANKPDVEIRGTAGILTFNLPMNFAYLMDQGFQSADIELDEDGTVLNYGGTNITVHWLFNGQQATREQMEAVLAEVTNFLIQAEYISGTDWAWLDEVEILAPNEPPAGGGYPGG